MWMVRSTYRKKQKAIGRRQQVFITQPASSTENEVSARAVTDENDFTALRSTVHERFS